MVIDTGGHYLYGMAHLPESNLFTTKVVICSPIGIEWSHSFFPLTRFSRNLAEKGIAVFRFDISGMGESSGNLVNQDLGNLKNELYMIIDHINEHFPAGKIVLMGFRFGGLLALSLLSYDEIEDIILFDPVLDLVQYRKEIFMTSILSGTYSNTGYLFSEKLIDSFQYVVMFDENIDLQKIKKIFFSKRGYLSNRRLGNVFKKMSHEVIELDIQADPFWNKQSLSICKRFERKVLDLLV